MIKYIVLAFVLFGVLVLSRKAWRTVAALAVIGLAAVLFGVAVMGVTPAELVQVVSGWMGN
jgi:O-antigen ligase